jgi:hypothetical protein
VLIVHTQRELNTSCTSRGICESSIRIRRAATRRKLLHLLRVCCHCLVCLTSGARGRLAIPLVSSEAPEHTDLPTILCLRLQLVLIVRLSTTFSVDGARVWSSRTMVVCRLNLTMFSFCVSGEASFDLMFIRQKPRGALTAVSLWPYLFNSQNPSLDARSTLIQL